MISKTNTSLILRRLVKPHPDSFSPSSKEEPDLTVEQDSPKAPFRHLSVPWCGSFLQPPSLISSSHPPPAVPFTEISSLSRLFSPSRSSSFTCTSTQCVHSLWFSPSDTLASGFQQARILKRKKKRKLWGYIYFTKIGSCHSSRQDCKVCVENYQLSPVLYPSSPHSVPLRKSVFVIKDLSPPSKLGHSGCESLNTGEMGELHISCLVLQIS